eukprot:gene11988-12132_t
MVSGNQEGKSMVDVVAWEVTLTHVPSDCGKDEDVKDMGLHLTVISLSGDECHFNLDGSEVAGEPASYSRFRPELVGRTDKYMIKLPVGFEPAAVKIRDDPDRGSLIFRLKGKFERFYLRRLLLRQKGTSLSEIHIMANSYISPVQGDRLFVRNDAWTDRALRKNAVITQLQEDELLHLRGEGSNKLRAEREPRVPGDRIYRFDVYNDLGKDPSNANNVRPILGGKENPYPRRMSTNRDLWPNTSYEKPPTKAGVLEPLVGDGLLGGVLGKVVPSPWVPEDDNFSSDKGAGFLGGALLGQLPAALQKIKGTFPAGKQFESIAQMLSLYDPQAFDGLVDKDHDLRDKLLHHAETKVDLRCGVAVDNTAATFKPIDLVKFDAPRSITTFEAPGVDDKDGANQAIRLPTWHTDQEFGRMFLAGQNPVVIEAVDSLESLERLLPSNGPNKTLIQDSDITAQLEGQSFKQMAESAHSGSERRLLVVDYWAIHQFLPANEADATAAAAEGKVLHAARAVLFRRSDGYLVPVAIELAHSQDTPAVVVTPNDPDTVWLLAKLLFMSVDSGWHQLVSHFVRTHAVVEPYLISLRRQMNPTHPVS